MSWKEDLEAKLADEIDRRSESFMPVESRALEAIRMGERRRSRATFNKVAGAAIACAFTVALGVGAWMSLRALGGEEVSTAAATVSNGSIVLVCEVPAQDREYSTSLCRLSPDGSELPPLTPPGSIDRQPEWSPDGTRIAFIRGDPMYDGDEVGTKIVIVTQDGDESIIPLPRRDYEAPTWSPDGQSLAFENQGQIFRVGVDGSDLMPVTGPHSDDLSAYTPAWSPDGTQIAFSGHTFDPVVKKSLQSIYLSDIDGSDRVEITQPDLEASAPAWSPDGRRLAFESQANDSIYLVNSDGTGLIRLTESGRAYDPEWSPDGGSILFTIVQGRDVRTVELNLETQEVAEISSVGGSATWQPVLAD